MSALSPLIKLLIFMIIGLLLSVGAALALVSSQAPEDLDVANSILSTYGER